MMAAVGAFLGPVWGMGALGIGMAFGGIVMAVHLLLLGRLREKLVAIRDMGAAAALTRSLAPLKISAESPEAIALPYSVPLGLGTIAVMVVASLLEQP